MAAYGIMRVEKRERSAVHGLQLEANRTKKQHEEGLDFDRSDINWSKTDQNIALKHCENWNREITKQIHASGLREKKNSIVLLDGLYTASPEWFASHTPEEALEFFKDCMAFHIREYCAGDESRLINAEIHLDETTPHMQVASVPIFEDEQGMHLSAKVIMGNRTDYSKRQDRFYNEVTKDRGMERGEVAPEKDAKRKHHELTQEYKIAKNEERIAKQEDTIDHLQTKAAEEAKNILADAKPIDPQNPSSPVQISQENFDKLSAILKHQEQRQTPQQLSTALEMERQETAQVRQKAAQREKAAEEREKAALEKEKQAAEATKAAQQMREEASRARKRYEEKIAKLKDAKTAIQQTFWSFIKKKTDNPLDKIIGAYKAVLFRHGLLKEAEAEVAKRTEQQAQQLDRAIDKAIDRMTEEPEEENAYEIDCDL